MKIKLPRVKSDRKDVDQLQSGAFPKIEAALNQSVTVLSFTRNTTGAVLQGYFEADTSFGTVWLPYYSEPTS